MQGRQAHFQDALAALQVVSGRGARIVQSASLHRPRSACGTSPQWSGRSSRSTRFARIALNVMHQPPAPVRRKLVQHEPVKQLLPTPPAPSTTIWYSRLEAHPSVQRLTSAGRDVVQVPLRHVDGDRRRSAPMLGSSANLPLVDHYRPSTIFNPEMLSSKGPIERIPFESGIVSGEKNICGQFRSFKRLVRSGRLIRKKVFPRRSSILPLIRCHSQVDSTRKQQV